MIKYWLLFFLILSLAACRDENVLYEENLPIENAVWKSDNMASFVFDIEDTLGYYDVVINLRNTETYPYSNIFLFADIIFPNGKKHLDTLNAELADPSGKWYGTGIGDIYDNSYKLVDNLAFPIKGEYKIQIVQAMRNNDLKGIENIGLKVKKHTQKF